MTAGPRERLVSSAIELVRRKGVAGTGLTELLEHSGTARRSIYQHFPEGKAELVAESTRTAGERMAGLLAALTDSGTTAQALVQFCAQWREILVGSGFEAGCPVVAAALGRSDAPAAADAAGTAFEAWEQVLAASMRREGVQETAAESLATMLVSAVEGAIVLSLAAQSAQPLERVCGHLVELIEHRAGS